MKLNEKIQHYGLEFVTVFLGVTLSLLAENWRQGRSDLTAQHDSLVQLYSDLRLEDGDMRTNMRTARIGLESARYLIQGVHGHNADSVSAALTGLGECSFFVPYQSEYTALKSSGRLSVIEEPALRQAIVGFYELDPFAQWLHERDCTLTGDLMDSMLGKLEFAEPVVDSTRARRDAASVARNTAPADSANRQRRPPRVPRYPRVVYKQSDEAVLNDPALRDRIVRLATQRNYLISQIQSRIDQATALRDSIKLRLGSDTLIVRRPAPRTGNPVVGGGRNRRTP